MIKLLLEPEMIPFMVAMVTTIFNQEQVMIKYMVKEEMTPFISAGADIEDGGEGIDTIIFGPDQTTLPVTINLDTGRYHFTSQIASVTQNLFSIENITSEGAVLI